MKIQLRMNVMHTLGIHTTYYGDCQQTVRQQTPTNACPSCAGPPPRPSLGMALGIYS